jgi:hypothetical protein
MKFARVLWWRFSFFWFLPGSATMAVVVGAEAVGVSGGMDALAGGLSNSAAASWMLSISFSRTSA